MKSTNCKVCERDTRVEIFMKVAAYSSLISWQVVTEDISDSSILSVLVEGRSRVLVNVVTVMFFFATLLKYPAFSLGKL